MASAEIYNKALDLLSRREHSRKELYLKLTKRFESKEDINFNLDRLEEKNLLSDSRFAEEYVQARRKKGFGPIKISAELEKRGVNESLISNEIDKFDDWEELAELSFKKRFDSFVPLFTPITKRPLASGSRVPKCPAFFIPKFFLTI